MMRQKSKYYIMNKTTDFEKGCGCVYKDESMILNNYYISKVFDGFETQMRWYKLVSDFVLPVNTYLKITFFTTDTKEIVFDGRTYSIQKVITSDMSYEQKCVMLEELKQMTVPMEKEILLTNLTGRYLFFMLESTLADEQIPKIYSMKLFYQPHMWSQELPEIFRMQQNDFLERYLAIFQSLYEDMEQQIENTPKNYAIECADYDFLKWLSGWYCLEHPEIWNEEQLRYLMKNALRFFKRIGTRQVIEEICMLYLGEKPEIIEYYQSLEPDYICPQGLIRQQIFINPYVFTIVVHERMLNQAEQKTLARIVDSCKPAHMEANIIVKSEKIRQNSYLNVGSRIPFGSMGEDELLILK